MSEKRELLEKTECKRQHFLGATQLHSVGTHKVQMTALSRCNSIAPNTLKCIQSTCVCSCMNTHVLKEKRDHCGACAQSGHEVEHVSTILPRVLAHLQWREGLGVTWCEFYGWGLCG